VSEGIGVEFGPQAFGIGMRYTVPSYLGTRGGGQFGLFAPCITGPFVSRFLTATLNHATSRLGRHVVVFKGVRTRCLHVDAPDI
jgi:hypothetical protein